MDPARTSPSQLFRSIIRDLRAGRDADGALAAIASALVVASSNASIEADSQLILFPKSHHIGWNRYGRMQDALLLVGVELGLPISHERHPGGTTSYAVLQNDRLWLTIASVRKYKDNPNLRPFRSGGMAAHHPWQLALFEPMGISIAEQLSATIVYGYERGNSATPQFIEVRFLNKNGHYMTECIDLLALLKRTHAPNIENVVEGRDSSMRKEKLRKKNA